MLALSVVTTRTQSGRGLLRSSASKLILEHGKRMEFKLKVNVYDAVIDGVPTTLVNDKTVKRGYGAFFSGIEVENGTEVSFLSCGTHQLLC